VKQKISIILPVHDAGMEIGAFVRDCLELTMEIGRACEIIVVDDASTDETVDILETLEQEYPQVSLISLGQSQGVVRAILRGLQQATGHLYLIYYITSGFSYPQIPVFCEGMAVTDAVVGRLVNGMNDFVSMVMLKQNVLDMLGESVADSEKMSSLFKSVPVRHIELRYECEIKNAKSQQKSHFSASRTKSKRFHITAK